MSKLLFNHRLSVGVTDKLNDHQLKQVELMASETRLKRPTRRQCRNCHLQ
jgi:hypothetical protein